MAKKLEVAEENEQEVIQKAYKPTSDFELSGRLFKAGKKFTPPFDWEVDAPFMEFRAVERKGKLPKGTAFIISEKRVILPVEEA